MTRTVATAVFTLAFWCALVLAQLIEIYAFGHFEGAIGNRFDNAILSGIIGAGLALAAGAGFSGVLLLWRTGRLQVPLVLTRLIACAVTACVLLYAGGSVRASLSNLPENWQFNSALVVAYCLLLGSLAAAVVAGLLAGARRAA